MKNRMQQRRATIQVHKPTPMDKVGATIKMFAKDGKYLGRLEFNFAGVDFYKPNAKVPIRAYWEKLIDKLEAS